MSETDAMEWAAQLQKRVVQILIMMDEKQERIEDLNRRVEVLETRISDLERAANTKKSSAKA